MRVSRPGRTGPVLEWADEVVVGVLQLEQVAAVLEAGQVDDGNERLDGAVPGAGAVTGEGSVDTVDVVLDRDQAVGHGQGEVPVVVYADLAARVKHVTMGTHAGGHVVRDQPAGVGDVDAVRASRLISLAGGELLGRGHVGERQETRDAHAELTGRGDVLGRDVASMQRVAKGT